MWTAIIILVLALILFGKIESIFRQEKPLDINTGDTGLSTSDIERFNKFRRYMVENSHKEQTFWDRVSAGTSIFGNVYNGQQNDVARTAGEVADLLRLVENKKRFGQVYRNQFNETIPTALIDSFGEGLYLTISTAVNGFGEFL